MAQLRETVVEINGEDFFGRIKGKKFDEWIAFGRERGQKWMYKGYRRYNHDSVVVFDVKRWSDEEIARRKETGFLGIREYYIG